MQTHTSGHLEYPDQRSQPYSLLAKPWVAGKTSSRRLSRFSATTRYWSFASDAKRMRGLGRCRRSRGQQRRGWRRRRGRRRKGGVGEEVEGIEGEKGGFEKGVRRVWDG